MKRLAAMRESIGTTLAPWQARWHALGIRDRRALLGMFFVILAVLGWQWVVKPLTGYAERQQQRLADEYQDLAWMQANAGLARQAGAGGAGTLPAGQSLLSVLNSSAREAGLNLQRFDPDGDSRVRIALENAVFTDVMRWVVDLEQRYGVTVSSLTADSQPQPGVVNIRLVLERRN